MEVLSSSRAVAQTKVHLLLNLGIRPVFSGVLIICVIQLQESLDTTGGVLRAGTVVAVGQEHHKTRLDVPFGFSGCNKLINHDLSAVCEVTELGFPEDKCGWVSLGVTKLESEAGVLRKM